MGLKVEITGKQGEQEVSVVFEPTKEGDDKITLRVGIVEVEVDALELNRAVEAVTDSEL